MFIKYAGKYVGSAQYVMSLEIETVQVTWEHELRESSIV